MPETTEIQHPGSGIDPLDGFRSGKNLVLLLLIAVAAGVLAYWNWKVAILLGLFPVALLIPSLPPRRVYIAFLCILPFSVEVPLGGTLELTLPTELLIPLLCLWVLVCSVDAKKVPIPRSRLYAPILVFCFYMAATVAATQPALRIVAAKAVLRDWTYVLGGFGLAVVLIRKRSHLKKVCIGMLAAAALIALYGILTQVRQGIRIYQSVASPFFQQDSACIYAAYLTFATVAVLGTIFSRREYRVGLTFLYLPLMLMALGISFVRGAWLSLVGSGLYYAWCSRRRMPRLLLLISVLVLISAPFAIYFSGLGPLFAERIEHFADPKFTTNLDRIDRWHAGAAIWKDHPFFGTGWGTYGDVYFDYVYDRSAYASQFRMGAHNLFLEYLADGGLVGCGLFVWVLVVYGCEARRVFSIVRKDPLCRTVLLASGGAMVSFLIHAQINNLGPSDKITVTFWFLIALVPITEHLWRTGQAEQEPHSSPSP
jgi:O-antigen ligase